MTVKPGQVWRDHDKRRTQKGTIRTVWIEHVGPLWLNATVLSGPSTGRDMMIRIDRFRPTANDGFELVEDVK